MQQRQHHNMYAVCMLLLLLLSLLSYLMASLMAARASLSSHTAGQCVNPQACAEAAAADPEIIHKSCVLSFAEQSCTATWQ
jgi:hypothetical protein